MEGKQRYLKNSSLIMKISSLWCIPFKTYIPFIVKWQNIFSFFCSKIKVNSTTKKVLHGKEICFNCFIVHDILITVIIFLSDFYFNKYVNTYIFEMLKNYLSTLKWVFEMKIMKSWNNVKQKWYLKYTS